MDSNTIILKNLRDINILLFNDIMESGDTTILVVKGDKEVLKEECDLIWSNLFDEYFKLKGDGRAINSIAKHNDMGKIRLKIKFIEIAITSLITVLSTENNDFIAETKVNVINTLQKYSNEFRKLNFLDSVEDTLDKLSAIHAIVKRQYDLIDKRKEQVTDKEVNNIERSLVNIQNVLGYAIGEFKTISVPYYIELERSAKDKIKRQKK